MNLKREKTCRWCFTKIEPRCQTCPYCARAQAPIIAPSLERMARWWGPGRSPYR